MHEIRIILKQNGRYIQGKFLELSAVYKARRSDVRHYETFPQSRFLNKEVQRAQLITTSEVERILFYLVWFPDYLY